MGIVKWGIIILLILVMGCASVETTITTPQNEIWIVQSKKDALVVLKQKDGTEITVDNRGKMSWIEGLMQYILAKPDIKLSNKEGS